MIIFLSPVALFADGTTDDGFSYTTENSEVTITDYSGSATDVTIPATIEGNPVTVIGDNAFSDCALLTITIPDAVLTIGDNAFRSCKHLEQVAIADSVTSIGDYAFYGCTALTSVTISNRLTSIGYASFAYCTALPDVVIPSGVTSIGGYAFLCCFSMTSATIPDGVTSIGDYAFNDCGHLENVTIPKSVRFIGAGAFRGTMLTKVTIPHGITTITNAFNSCTFLKEVTIPDSVTSIESEAFAYCYSLTSVTIPASVTSIGMHSFLSCTGLREVVFLGDAPNMGSEVFGYNAPDFSVYYRPNATGFTSPTWSHHESESCNSAILTDGPAWADSYESPNDTAWCNSSWYGWFYAAPQADGWIYDLEMGWQYIYDLGGASGIIAYDTATNAWWFTSVNFYPYFYDYTNETWLYYYEGGVTPNRYFWSDRTNSVVSESNLRGIVP